MAPLRFDLRKIRYKKDFWNENIIMEGVNYKLKWIVWNFELDLSKLPSGLSKM